MHIPFLVVTQVTLRLNPELKTKLKKTRALLRHKSYRDEFRRGLLAYRSEQKSRLRMIIPRLSG
jgi:hypothetical protein